MRYYFLILLACSILCVQCIHQRTDNNNSSVPTYLSDHADSLKNLNNIILSPNEIITELLTGTKWLNTDIVNPKTNSVKYINTNREAINLGVYIADFAYLNFSENRTNALDYFKVIRDLAQKNDIYGCFDAIIFDRIQNNLANRDSLVLISQEMYYHMSDILENSNRPKVNAFISSGALVESLYLTVMNISKYSDNEPLVKKLFEQEQLVQSLNSFISTFKNDPDSKTICEQINSLKIIMDQAERKYTKRKVTRDKNNHFDVKGGEDRKVTEILFNEFKNKVILIRNDMVNVSN